MKLHDMKKLLAILLCIALIITFTACCGQTAAPDAPDPADISDADEEHQDPAAEDQYEPEHFDFQPKVTSSYLREIFGDEMIESWYSLVDAVMAGEETFSCPDNETYDWVMGQFPERCFPVLTDLIAPDYGAYVENGTGRIIYLKSKEETAAEIADFAALIEDILTDTMKHDYTDLEKCLSLYRYFYNNYEYDYDAYEEMRAGDQSRIHTYRFLTEKQGICQEIAHAYSYILMQVGVDATVMMGNTLSTNEGHVWSYVKINGRNYHIVPTYVLSEYGNLGYFMMTDEKRADDFDPAEFIVTSNYTQDHEHPDYKADDDTFSPLWDGSLEDFVHKTHTIYYYEFDETGDSIRKEFDYEGF